MDLKDPMVSRHTHSRASAAADTEAPRPPAGATHGGLQERDLAALGLDPSAVLDLSANLNPFGPPPAVLEAIARAPLGRYPDPACRAARGALAQACDAMPSQVVLGNGASELLWSAIAAVAPPGSGRAGVVPTPAFGEVEAACGALSVPMHRVVSQRDEGLRPNVEALAEQTRKCGAVWVYLCNPGTPTGAATSAESLRWLAGAIAPSALILDESFLSLSELWEQANEPLADNVVRVRSLTKEFAVPGVRIGYALARPELCAQVEVRRPAWSVGAAAQAVAECAPSQRSFVASSRQRLSQQRQTLVAGLRALGLRPFPSVAPYVAFPCDDAAELRCGLLLRHGVGVRDCRSFGLPNVVRVAVRSDPDCRRLLRALACELSRQPRPASGAAASATGSHASVRLR